MNTKTLLVDIDKAPDSVLRELKTLGDKAHTQEDFEKLSDDTKRWLNEHAKDPKSSVAFFLKRGYKNTVREIEMMVVGIQTLKSLIGEKEADELNLEIFNACAHYVRQYNESKL